MLKFWFTRKHSHFDAVSIVAGAALWLNDFWLVALAVLWAGAWVSAFGEIRLAAAEAAQGGERG